MKLSEAILKGCNKSHQIQYYFSKDGGTCALGAAMLGLLGKDVYAKGIIDHMLYFPILNKYIENPVTNNICQLQVIVMYLNDVAKWSRERIATWIANEVEGKDLTRNTVERELELV